MEKLPLFIPVIFGATVVLAIWLFYIATNYSKSFLLLVAAWVILQSLVSASGFYTDPATMTIRFPFLVVPPLLVIIAAFVTERGKNFIDQLSLPALTIFHIIRIPVELVLYWLFLSKAIPEAMTFHGRNFDLFSGITAPFIYYFGFVRNKLNRSVIIVWNLVCLGLLLNVVANALLSLPGRFLHFDFEQANIGLGYFPFTLLPACLVPLVLFAMLAAIRQLARNPLLAL
jgi:hypothetical protein